MPKILQTILFEEYKSLNKELSFGSDVLLVLKTSYQTPLKSKKWNALLNILSFDLVNEVTKYKNWEDRHNALFGKLLVFLGHYILTEKELNFDTYKRDNNNKPFLEDLIINFNISHSGKAVVCAISQANIKLGVDIEEIKKINITDLKNIFHPNEYTLVNQANNIKEFYKFWTRKEALTKAIGKGILFPLHTLDTTRKIINEDKNSYRLESHKLNEYFCSLAYNHSISKINWIEVEF